MAEQRRRGLSVQEATPVVGTAAAKPAKAKDQPPARPWWWHLTPAGIKNEAEYRIKQVRRINASNGNRYVGGVPGVAGMRHLYMAPSGTLGPSTSQRDILRGAAQVPVNAAILGTNVVQRVVGGGKPADPRSTGLGAVERGLNTAFGVPQPEQRKPEDLFWQQMGEQFTAGALGAAVGAQVVGPAAFTQGAMANMAPWAQQALRWGAGTGIESFVATGLTDNLAQGNVANAFGEDAPMAVGPTDDPLSAAGKSLLPNAAAELTVAGAFLGLGQGLGAIGRRLKVGREVEEVANARQWAVENGIQTEADGTYNFPEQPAPPKPEPVPAPTTRAQAEEQLLGPEPTAPEVPSQEMAPGGAVTDGELPSADPGVDPWYDPALPEVDTAVRAVQRLDDEALIAAASGDGPVLPTLEQQLQAQQQNLQVEPGLTPDVLAAPTDRLANPMVPYADQWAQLPNTTLLSLAAPENNPQLYGQVRRLTGREFGEFTRADVIDGLKALEKDGITILPNRALDTGNLLNTADIGVDPARFQYKDNVNAQGQQRGNSLEGVERWNTDAEGSIQVWNDPQDGRTYVVNGHNRVAKAQELGIPTLRSETLLAPTAEAARAQGAISNIADGKGTPFDAAKVVRELGIQDAAGLEAVGIPLQSGLGTQGLALSKLPDNLFQQAVNGELSMGRALALGGSGLDAEGMTRVVQLAQGRDMTDRTFSELTQMASTAPKVESDQMGLFGPEVIDTTVIKADLAGRVRAELTSNKNLFKKVGKKKAATALSEKAGTQVDQGAAATAADTAAAVLEQFDQTKYAAETPISQLLNDGAAEIAAGAKPAVVMKRILQQLETAAEAAPPAPKPQVEVPVEQVAAEPAPLTPEQRTELQKQVVQKAVQNGEVRPSETPLPELPEGPRNLDDPLVTLEDEVRLANEYGMEDTIRAHVEKLAERERMGWDGMSLDEKKANGMLDDWDTRGEGLQDKVMDIQAEGVISPLRTPEWIPQPEEQFRTTLEDVITEAVGRITGIDDPVFSDRVARYLIPPEHGGDGIKYGTQGGFYEPMTDIVNILGLLDRPPGQVLETTYHESWHRIQYTLLTQKDMEVFDSVFGKARVNDYSAMRGAQGKASLEKQAYAFQAYAALRAEGLTPMADTIRVQMVDMLDEQLPRKDGKSWQGTFRGEAAVRIMQGFERLVEFLERINNAVRGRGFESVQSLYEKAFQGELAKNRALDYVAMQSTPDQKARLAKLSEWRADNRKAVSEVNQMIASIDEQISALKAQAMSGGC